MPSQFYEVKLGTKHDECQFCPCDPDEESKPTVNVNLRGAFTFRVCFECLRAFTDATISMLADAAKLRQDTIDA